MVRPMSVQRGVFALVVSMAFAVCLALPASADLEAVSRTSVDRPTDDTPTEIKSLFIGSREMKSVAEITSVRLKEIVDPKAETIRLVWEFLAGNTRSITQKALIEMTLRDETGKQLAKAKTLVILNRYTKDRKVALKMKVASADWEATESIRIQVQWRT